MTAEPTKADSVKAAMRRYFPVDVLRSLEIKRHKEAMAALDRKAGCNCTQNRPDLHGHHPKCRLSNG